MAHASARRGARTAPSLPPPAASTVQIHLGPGGTLHPTAPPPAPSGVPAPSAPLPPSSLTKSRLPRAAGSCIPAEAEDAPPCLARAPRPAARAPRPAPQPPSAPHLCLGVTVTSFSAGVMISATLVLLLFLPFTITLVM